MITLVDVLRQSIDELHGRMNAIEAGAVAEQRDTLNDAEQATWDEFRAEAQAKTDRLGLLVDRGEEDHRAGELVARMSGTGRGIPDVAHVAERSAFPYSTPGEYVLAYMRSKHGDPGEGARFTRALADVTTAQTPGLVPPQVTGDVLGTWLGNRPSVDAMSKPSLPPVGMEIQRPHICQHTDVGPHAEKVAVVSQSFHLDLVKIELSSYAGAVDVSWELANRSSPSALDIIFSDLVSVYGREVRRGRIQRDEHERDPVRGVGRDGREAGRGRVGGRRQVCDERGGKPVPGHRVAGPGSVWPAGQPDRRKRSAPVPVPGAHQCLRHGGRGGEYQPASWGSARWWTRTSRRTRS